MQRAVVLVILYHTCVTLSLLLCFPTFINKFNLNNGYRHNLRLKFVCYYFPYYDIYECVIWCTCMDPFFHILLWLLFFLVPSRVHRCEYCCMVVLCMLTVSGSKPAGNHKMCCDCMLVAESLMNMQDFLTHILCTCKWIYGNRYMNEWMNTFWPLN